MKEATKQWTFIVLVWIVCLVLFLAGCSTEVAEPGSARKRFSTECEQPESFSSTAVCIVFDSKTKREYVLFISYSGGVTVLQTIEPEPR